MTAARPLRFALDQGTIEACWYGPEAAAAGDAPPTIVLLHEGLGCVALWRDFPRRLSAATGCGVLAYSRFGYGQSDGAPLPWPPSYLHDHARHVLPRVIDAAGLRRYLLLGHSDGGSIATVAAAEAADARLRGVILLAAHFFVEPVTLRAIAAARAAYETGTLRARLARYHRDADNAFYGWNRAWLDPAFAALDLSPQLAALRVPVLAMQGEADEYGTPAQLDRVRDGVPAPRDVRLIPGARHSPQDQAPDQVLKAISTFMQDNALLPDRPPCMPLLAAL